MDSLWVFVQKFLDVKNYMFQKLSQIRECLTFCLGVPDNFLVSGRQPMARAREGFSHLKRRVPYSTGCPSPHRPCTVRYHKVDMDMIHKVSGRRAPHLPAAVPDAVPRAVPWSESADLRYGAWLSYLIVDNRQQALWPFNALYDSPSPSNLTG